MLRKSLVYDAYTIAIHPTARFLKQVYIILFRPSTFAEKFLHLGDQSNFLRQVRFFIEAATYVLILSAATAYLTRYVFTSEVRYWVHLAVGTILLLAPFHVLNWLATGRNLNFKDTLHVLLPVFAATSISTSVFRALYWGLDEILAQLLGHRFVHENPLAEFNVAYMQCLSDQSVILASLFGQDLPGLRSKSPLAAFFESGGICYVLGVYSAAVISGKKFGIGRLHAALIALSSIVAAIVGIFGLFSGAALIAEARHDCVNTAYLRIGQKNPRLLLEQLVTVHKGILPVSESGRLEDRGMSFDERGLVQVYYDPRSYDDAGYVALAQRAKKTSVDVFCKLSASTDLYFSVIRQLGLGITYKYLVAGRETAIVVHANDEACRLNFAPKVLSPLEAIDIETRR